MNLAPAQVNGERMEYEEFGKFTLLDHMGKGGVASVYRANDNEAGNIVAIKIFEPTDTRPPDVVRKLRDREVRMLISMQHPNVVKYYESGSVDESYYYTMEFVENSLLERMRESDGLEVIDKVHILRQTSNALQAIHHQGIVHRDIKPGNILLDEAPSGAIHVKVTDLGIAKHVSETDIVRDEESSRRVPGTPKYLSPEQIQLKPVDGRADIFSLGVVAFELLAGQPPFQASTSDEYLRANLNQDVEPAHHVNGDIPAFISPMVSRMLKKDREDRYDSDTLARDLELTYQHLVSDAPLVENENPESIYYVPPVPEGEEEPVPEEEASRTWQYVVSLGLLLIGIGVCLKFYPRFESELPQHEAPSLGGLQMEVGEALDKTRELLAANSRWEALAFLRNLRTKSMNQEQKLRWQRYRDQVQRAVVSGAFEQAKKEIEQGHLTEAKIVLKRMEDFFPLAPETAEIEKEIEEYVETQEERHEWQDTVISLNKAVANREWEETIEQAEKLLGKVSDSKRKSQLQKLIVKAVNGWQEKVLNSEPDPRKIRELREELQKYRRRSWAKGKIEDHGAEFLWQTVRYWARLKRPEETLDACQKLFEEYPGSPEAQKARQTREGIVQKGLKLDPYDLEVVAGDISANGFKGKTWYTRCPEGCTQEIEEGVLRFTLEGGTAEREANRSRIRPIRSNRGFDLRLKFRMKAHQEDEIKISEAGFRIRDRGDNKISMFFDGSDYQMERALRGLTGRRELQDGFADEDEEWYELSALYQYDLSKLRLYVDGLLVAEESVELGVFKLTVFARVKGGGKMQAEFKDIKCDLP